MKLETAINIRNKCSIPIVSNFLKDASLISSCKKCSLFKRIEVELNKSVLVCEVVTDFLKIRIATENFFIQCVKEVNFVEELCEDLVNEVMDNES